MTTGLLIPKHVAIIMDGNGRWAESRGLPREQGHAEGAERVREIVKVCREAGVKAVTMYSFSTENWARPSDEVVALMGLLYRYLVEQKEELLEQEICFRPIGQLERLPDFVMEPLRALQNESANMTGMTLSLALSYGSRTEITEAVRSIAEEVAAGKMSVGDITEDSVSSRLYTAGLPEPDLLIRTSGELRLSNFLLWQLAYTEIYITDTPWPDFRRPQLEKAFAAFSDRERRFGKTSKQVQED